MKRLLALFAVVAVGITVAALTVPSTAATVNGQRISTTNLDNDLAAIDASPGYLCYLQASVLLDSGGQDQLPQLSGVAQPGSTSANGTYNSAFVRYWLSRLVSSQVVDQVTASRGITVSDVQLATARSETEQVIDGAFATLEQDGVQPSCSGVPTGSQVLGSLPTSFVDSLVRAQASSDLLAASVVGSNLTPVSMARYFAAHPSDFDTLCVNGFAVTSEASANQIRASVLAGTPFASAAPSGSSVQSACFAATSANYGAISQAVGKLPIGGVSQPLESSQGSYYLFELTKRTPTSLSGARSVLRGTIVDAGLAQADQLLSSAEHRATVSVDPRYGGWESTKGAIGLVAATSPPSTALLSPTANVPGSTTTSTKAAQSSASASG